MSSRPASGQRRRVAVVTGAGKGIGLATAIALAEDGTTVLMWGRTLVPDALNRVRALSPASEFTLVDVSEAEVVERSVSAAISAHGALDVLVNCAGIAHRGPLEPLRLPRAHLLGVEGDVDLRVQCQVRCWIQQTPTQIHPSFRNAPACKKFAIACACLNILQLCALKHDSRIRHCVPDSRPQRYDVWSHLG
jgi:hypothetical protein